MSIFKKHIADMSAYKPPLEGRNPLDHTLLDFNERTIPVSDTVKQAIIDYINSDRLQMYPAYGDICQRLAAYCGVNENQVMATNGSDQGIELIFRAACREGDTAIIPGPSFPMYRQCASIENLNIVEPHYTREAGFPAKAVLKAITPTTRIIVIANPNNPCGTLVSEQSILDIAKAAPNTAILVDECYFEYTQATVAGYLDEYPNLLITRTLSKTWGLASVRFGYILSTAKNIDTLLNVRGPYDINQLSVVAAQAALSDAQYTQDFVNEVMTQSKPMFETFLASQGIDFWPGAANYLWVFPPEPDALKESLQAQGILVRPKADAEGRMGLRVTLGTKEQTQQLIDVLKSCLV